MNKIYKILLFIVAAFVNVIAEDTFLPVFVMMVYYFVGLIPIVIPRISRYAELEIYTSVYLVGSVCVGIAALYRAFSNDTQGDASHFFFDSQHLLDLPMEGLLLTYENSIPLIVFNYIFYFFDLVGVQPAQYVVIFFNTMIVSWSGVLTLKTANIIYGNDSYREQRLIVLYSCIGIFWLYGSLLLRDSFALLIISMLTYSAIKYLANPWSALNIFISIFSFVLFGFALKYVRAEFVYIPLAISLAAAILLFSNLFSKLGLKNKYLLFVFGLIVIAIIPFTPLYEILVYGRESYDIVSSRESNPSSLGYSLIVSQPTYIRAIFGSISLITTPIPIWIGFQLTSVYHLFKSLNTIALYFVIPFVIMAISQIFLLTKTVRTSVLFLLMVFFGFTIAVSMTSLESRHLGVFYPMILLVALVPDLRPKDQMLRYVCIFIVYMFIIVLAHLLWAFYKFM